MDPLGLQKALDKANTDLATAMTAIGNLTTRIEQLEDKTARDIGAIADKVLAGIRPEVDAAKQSIDTMTLTVNAGVTELIGIVKRLDHAQITVTLGPEGGA